jgi:hypothetical protein
VQVDLSRLMQNGVTLDQVLRTSANALWVSPLTFVEASTPGLGGFTDTANQRIEVQHNQPIKTAAELGKVTVQGAENRGLKLADVASIVEDHQILIGDAVVKESPSLMLVVERFPGAKVSDVTRNVEAALDELRPGLAGVTVDTMTGSALGGTRVEIGLPKLADRAHWRVQGAFSGYVRRSGHESPTELDCRWNSHGRRRSGWCGRRGGERWGRRSGKRDRHRTRWSGGTRHSDHRERA